MRAWPFFVAVLVAASSVAFAQTRLPDWARPIVISDIEALRTVGPTLSPSTGGVAARVVVSPTQGGVARLIRYDSDGKTGVLRVWRYTGHPRSGYVLWGGESPLSVPVTAAERAAFDQQVRSAARAAALSLESSDTGKVCDGDYAFIESSDGARQNAVERRCSWAGTSGGLARALSNKAGSRDEQELVEAGIAELKSADVQFARASATKGLGAALLSHIDFEARASGPGMPSLVGAEAIEQHFADRAAPRPIWTPEGADLAARGDMGVTWGRWSDAAAKMEGSYLTSWRRDFDGAWKVAATMRVAD